MTLATLARAIGYPQEVPAEASTFDFVVDGARVSAEAEAGRFVLARVLAHAGDLAEGAFARLAGYAAGRALKEDAALAWDPRQEALVLWQALPLTEAPAALKLFFEVFCASCDWWAARVTEAPRPDRSSPEMLILP